MIPSSPSDSTNHLREKIRIYQTAERNSKRENKADSSRPGLGEISKMIKELENITEKDVSGLASRIKRRKRADCDDMFRLSHAFLQSEQNIVTFVKIPGALNVVVKELTSSDSKSQIIACEVLCNLSLGAGVPCEKIAAAAGSYLITNLDSCDLRLQKTSLWTITNIISTDGKGLNILVSQEIVPKLLHLLVANNHPDLDQDILLAVDILLDKDINLFSSQQQLTLRNHLQTRTPTTAIHLKMLFSIYFDKETPFIEENDVDKILNDSISLMHDIQNVESHDKVLCVLYSIRIIANLVAKFPASCESIDNICRTNFQIEIVDIINKVFAWNIKEINRETMWFLGNLESCQNILNKPKNMLNRVKVSKLVVL